jgi:hypothetical protein
MIILTFKAIHSNWLHIWSRSWETENCSCGQEILRLFFFLVSEFISLNMTQFFFSLWRVENPYLDVRCSWRHCTVPDIRVSIHHSSRVGFVLAVQFVTVQNTCSSMNMPATHCGVIVRCVPKEGNDWYLNNLHIDLTFRTTRCKTYSRQRFHSAVFLEVLFKPAHFRL